MIILVVSMWMKATFWGLVAGSALILGALAGYFIKVPSKVIAFVMAFGSGVLISALAFDLMNEAYKRGGFGSTAIGFVAGAVVFSLGNFILGKKGAKHRKRSGNQQPKEEEQA